MHINLCIQGYGQLSSTLSIHRTVSVNNEISLHPRPQNSFDYSSSTTTILNWKVDISDKARISSELGVPYSHSFEVFYSVLDTNMEAGFSLHWTKNLLIIVAILVFYFQYQILYSLFAGTQSLFFCSILFKDMGKIPIN